MKTLFPYLICILLLFLLWFNDAGQRQFIKQQMKKDSIRDGLIEQLEPQAKAYEQEQKRIENYQDSLAKLKKKTWKPN